MNMRAGVHRKGEIRLSDLITRVKSSHDVFRAGAIACFIGIVRGITKDGKWVKKLEIEAWEERATEVLTKICDDLRRREGILDVSIHHVIGELSVGEDIVYVVVAGSHRDEVFQVLREAVERYKREAPIWKKEHLETGESYWISEGFEKSEQM